MRVSKDPRREAGALTEEVRGETRGTPDRKAQDAYEARIQRAGAELRRQADLLTQLYRTVPCGIIQFATDGVEVIQAVFTDISEIRRLQEEREWDCLGKIDASSRYLLALINDILDMSKIEQGKMSLSSAPFVLGGLLDELEAVHRPLCGERGLELTARRGTAPGRRYAGDALRLNQILMNLVSNAIKFTPPGGRVAVEAEEHRTAGGRAGLRFRVSDTGVGVSAAFMERLYQPKLRKYL